MEVNKVYFGDCMDLAKTVPDDYVDLIVTSPPYADTLSYGKEIPVFHPDNYPEWFLQLATEAGRFLKPTGSFILNINDKIINGRRSVYVYKLLCLIEERTGLSLHDRYVWAQKSGIPTGGPRRLNDKMEYIFHFCRKKKRARGEGYTQQNENFKSNIDEVREPFGKKGFVTKGSSSMPHKRNPELSERICGLARVIRSNSSTAMQNIPLWHERDISHSSAERVILPDSSIATDTLFLFA